MAWKRRKMECKSYQRLLHLNRRGEISGRQWRKLERHLAVCGRCAEKAKMIERTDPYLQALRDIEPELDDGEALTKKVLDKIDKTSLGSRRKLWGESLYRGVSTRSFPLLQPALIGIVLVTVCAFLFQEFVILDQVSRLEKKVASYSAISGAPGIGNPQISALNRRMDRLEEQYNLFDRALSGADRETGRVLLDTGTLNTLMSEIVDLQLTNAILVEMLTDISPELGALSLEDGLSSTEFSLILKNRREIINALLQL